MSVEEKHEFKFSCDRCGKEETMFIPEIPEGWNLIVRNAHIDVIQYQYGEARGVPPTLIRREYKTKHADVQSFLCPECADDVYNMYNIECL